MGSRQKSFSLPDWVKAAISGTGGGSNVNRLLDVGQVECPLGALFLSILY
jgi:hypothetical protein